MAVGEPMTDAVARVAEEELGLEVVAGRLLGYIEYPSHLRTGLGWPVGIAFDAHPSGGAAAIRPDPRAVAWFGGLPARMHDEQRAFLAHVLGLMPQPARERTPCNARRHR